jgi:hypothetical protein
VILEIALYVVHVLHVPCITLISKAFGGLGRSRYFCLLSGQERGPGFQEHTPLEFVPLVALARIIFLVCGE